MMTPEEQKKFEELLAQAGPIIAGQQPTPADNSRDFLPPDAQHERAQLGDLPLTAGKVPPIPLAGPAPRPMSLAPASEAPKPPVTTLPTSAVTADPQEASKPPASDNPYDADAIMKLYAQRIMAAQNPTAEQRQLNSKWGQAESQSLDRLTGKGSDRENLGMVLASLLPAVVGTGAALTDHSNSTRPGMRAAALGKIAEASSANVAHLLRDRDQRDAQALSLADKASDVRRTLGDKSIGNLGSLVDKQQERARLEIALKNLGLRGTTVGMQADEHAFKYDPNNPQAMKIKQDLSANGVPAEQLDGLAAEALKHIKPITDNAINDTAFYRPGGGLQQASDKAVATTAATTDTKSAHEAVNAPRDADTAGVVGAGREAGTVTGKRAGERADRPVPAGYEVKDQKLFDNANEDPATREKMRADTSSARVLNTGIERMEELRRKNGPEWHKSANRGEYNALQSAVIGAFNRTVSDAGVLNPSEFENAKRMFPGIELNWSDALHTIIFNDDINADQLLGMAKGINTLTNARLEGYGVGRSKSQAKPKAAGSSGSDWSKYGL